MRMRSRSVRSEWAPTPFPPPSCVQLGLWRLKNVSQARRYHLAQGCHILGAGVAPFNCAFEIKTLKTPHWWV